MSEILCNKCTIVAQEYLQASFGVDLSPLSIKTWSNKTHHKNEKYLHFRLFPSTANTLFLYPS